MYVFPGVPLRDPGQSSLSEEEERAWQVGPVCHCLLEWILRAPVEVNVKNEPKNRSPQIKSRALILGLLLQLVFVG